MAISDLQARQGKIELIAKVVEKGEVREFNKFGNAGRVCNATIEDPTGQVKLTLWNEQIDQVNVGDKIQISNGYVGEWQGELQLSTGKFGTLKVIEKGSGITPQEAETDDEKTEAELLTGKETDKGTHILTDDEKKEEEIFEEPKPKKGKQQELNFDDVEEEDVSDDDS